MTFFARLRSGIASVLRPPVERVPRSWLHCPVCDQELVGPYPAGARTTAQMGTDSLAPSRAELIAKCPTHGKVPYNVPAGGPELRRAPMRGPEEGE